jgi:hypothetical protein
MRKSDHWIHSFIGEVAFSYLQLRLLQSTELVAE